MFGCQSRSLRWSLSALTVAGAFGLSILGLSQGDQPDASAAASAQNPCTRPPSHPARDGSREIEGARQVDSHAASTFQPAASASQHGPQDRAPQLAFPEENAVREILEIRREHGGVLDGTLLDEIVRPAREQPASNEGRASWQDDEFAKALRDVAASSAVQRQPPVLVPTTSPAAIGVVAQATPPSSPTPDLESVDLPRLLRLTARRLDTQAASLEESGAYRQADQLRALGGRLWRTARTLGTSASPTTEQAAAAND